MNDTEGPSVGKKRGACLRDPTHLRPGPDVLQPWGLSAAQSPCPGTLPTVENISTWVYTLLHLVLKETKFSSNDLQPTVETCSPQVASFHLSAPHASARGGVTVSSTSGYAKGTRGRL